MATFLANEINATDRDVMGTQHQHTKFHRKSLVGSFTRESL